VFCEKPLATRLEDAERIVAAAARSDMHLGVDYSRRFAFGYRTARQLLDRGSIGKLNYALVRVSDRTPPTEVARHPHVIFTTLLTHHLDLLRWYGGEICRIQAHSGGETGGGLMHSVSLSLTFANRAIGTIVAGYRDGQTRTAEWLELGGESGAIVVEDVTRRVILSLADADRRESFEPNHFTGGDAFYDSLGEHLRTFIEMVAHGQPPPVTGHDGVASLRLAAAAIRSLETGQAIEV
jgi:myo-inositol 2-dehydrogenase/D-chiro-inositol 1-dehydrogenase